MNSLKTVGEGHWEDMTTGWHTSWTSAIRSPSLSPLSFGCTFCPLFLQSSHFQGCSIERAVCWWDHMGDTHDWTHWRPLYKLLRFWWEAGAEIYSYCGCLRQASFVVSCLLNVPLSLLSLCPSWGGSFRFYPGKLLSLQTNKGKNHVLCFHLSHYFT